MQPTAETMNFRDMVMHAAIALREESADEHEDAADGLLRLRRVELHA